MSRAVNRGLGLAGTVLALATVGLQIAYPPAPASARADLSIVTVLTFAAASLTDAGRTAGSRAVLALLVSAAGLGGMAEVVGVHTGSPFGSYTYADSLGVEVLGVPLIVPLAWTMAAWPAWRIAGTVAPRRPGTAPRVVRWLAAAWALASWDLFLDPQMVAGGEWRWADPHPALPGVAGVPVSNFIGWLLVAAAVAGALEVLLGARLELGRGPGLVVGLLAGWTWIGGIVVNAVFFHRPGVALWGGLAMGLVAVPAIGGAVGRWRRPVLQLAPGAQR